LPAALRRDDVTLLTFRARLKALNFLLAQRFWGVAKGRYINFLNNNNNNMQARTDNVGK